MKFFRRSASSFPGSRISFLQDMTLYIPAGPEFECASAAELQFAGNDQWGSVPGAFPGCEGLARSRGSIPDSMGQDWTLARVWVSPTMSFLKTVIRGFYRHLLRR